MNAQMIETLDYASSLAARTPHETGEWLCALDRAGGVDAARLLLEQTGEPVWLWTPLLLDLERAKASP